MKKGEQPLEFSERVVEVIRSEYRYDFTIAEKRASVVCDQATNDCAGMTYVFVAAMRANRIPARVLVGRLAKPRKEGVQPTDNQYDQPHVRAEFYWAGVGWVPVDSSYANTIKTRPVRDFIGNDPGDMLVLHVDVDLQLPYPDQMRTAFLLQVAPNYYTYGKGTFDGFYGPTGWRLVATPIEKKK